MFFKKPSSVVTENEGATIHPKAVIAVVSWSESAIALKDDDKDKETSAGDVKIQMRVQPELKLPTKGAKG